MCPWVDGDNFPAKGKMPSGLSLWTFYLISEQLTI